MSNTSLNFVTKQNVKHNSKIFTTPRCLNWVTMVDQTIKIFPHIVHDTYKFVQPAKKIFCSTKNSTQILFNPPNSLQIQDIVNNVTPTTWHYDPLMTLGQKCQILKKRTKTD